MQPLFKKKKKAVKFVICAFVVGSFLLSDVSESPEVCRAAIFAE